MSLRPRDMPKLRDQTLRHLDDPTSNLRAKTGDENATGLDGLASHLRVGGLYWVAPDMAALAMSSGSQLAAARWATADRPTPCGLIMFDGGIGHFDARGVQIPIEACAWGPYEGECMLWLLMSRRRLVAEMARANLRLDEEQAPPLLPVHGFTVPVTTQPAPLADLDPSVPLPVIAALAASWLLMQQPNLIDRTRERPDKSVRRSYARAGREDPEVTVVDLRRQYVPDTADPDSGRDGRHYRHRWVVSGHWRNQPHGPGQSERRQTWIESYVKGPDGAPLLSTERVNVWRR
ncbi:hypothetical protein [Streptomyces axinellae]|uniref:Uncharacterized protein n=1 Tax=Streptomyces axinellae TaxID=552788 RepID=A0ABN3R120_9ACTN